MLLNQHKNNIQVKRPLIHCITNAVTIESVADGIHAVGGSPIMADAREEMASMSKKADGHYINIGMLNQNKIDSINELISHTQKPILLDPVGIATSQYRYDFVLKLIQSKKITVIKGNIAEINKLVGLNSQTIGVESIESEIGHIQVYQSYCKENELMLIITGETDYIVDKNNCISVENGAFMLKHITGGGCMAGGVILTETIRNNQSIEAVLTGLLRYTVASELAFEKDKNMGPSTFKQQLIDQLYLIEYETMSKKGVYDVQ